jgi:F0F1-type ATP synthase membrane subunit c/vacuolar-type H+-ATPase subunit K
VKEILLIFIPVLVLVPPAVAAAFAMRKISSTAIEGMTRQPQIAQQLFMSMLVSMALVEALVIYCLVVALLLAGKV